MFNQFVDVEGVIDFDYKKLNAEGFVDTEYVTWINVIEVEFPESDLYYPEPDEYL